MSQPIPVGPPGRSMSTSTTTYRQQLISMPEEESLNLNDECKSEEIAAVMVAGTYSSTKSFKQGSIPVSKVHGEVRYPPGTSHQPESHIQPATIHQEAIVQSFPPPQRQKPQASLSGGGPLFHIPDSTLEKSASEGSLQDIIPVPSLENPPAEVKSKPVCTTLDARESFPAPHVVPLPQPIPCSLNPSHATTEPGAAPTMEGASYQVLTERSLSSLSDASTQTILKGSPFMQGISRYKNT